MLDDLLTNTLDPGYRRAAEAGKPARGWEGPAAWLGCLIIGLTLVVAYQQSHRSAPARARVRHDLIERIHVVEQAADRRDSDAKSLATQVAALRDSELSKTLGKVPSGQEISSGAVAVTGPGVEISLGEPALSASAAAAAQPVLQDSDIRAVVNQLWASGAEAIAVNNVRLTSTSAIRVAGTTVFVDLQPVTSPYSIRAIGDSNTLLVGFADSPEANALQTKKGVDGISFDLRSQPIVRLPAGTPFSLRYASAGAPAQPAPSSSPR